MAQGFGYQSITANNLPIVVLSSFDETKFRRYTFPDRDGTIAMLDDIGGGGGATITGSANQLVASDGAGNASGDAGIVTAGGALTITAGADSRVPLTLLSHSVSQSGNLLEVHRFGNGTNQAAFSVDYRGGVTIGPQYDYVTGRHPPQHVIRYVPAGGYGASGILVNDIASGSAVRLHTISNTLYITDGSGSPAPLTLGLWSNPGDSSQLRAQYSYWDMGRSGVRTRLFINDYNGASADGLGTFIVQAVAANSTAIGAKAYTSQTDPLYAAYNSSNTLIWSVDASGNVVMADGKNIIAGTSTGTKIGTSTSQKLGLWNATPVVQPTTGVSAASFVANSSGIANDTATFGGYTIGQVVAALKAIGALA